MFVILMLGMQKFIFGNDPPKVTEKQNKILENCRKGNSF